MVAATLAATTVSVLPAAGAATVQSKRCGRIAWTGYDGTSLQIWTATAGGTNRRAVSNVGSGAPTANDNAEWSPDGTKLVWQGSDGTTNQIWVADADGSNRTAISNVVVPLTLNSDPAWSPDGTRIAWSGKIGDIQAIYTADTDGNNLVRMSTPSRFEVDTEPLDNRSPVWSPDGSQIAWSGKLTPAGGLSTTDIYVARADGIEPKTNLSSPPGLEGLKTNLMPAWSPDGTEIAWSAVDIFSGLRDIYRVQSNGTGTRPAVSGGGVSSGPIENVSPTWSPDGTRIAWSGQAQTGPAAGTYEVFTADVDGANRVEFAVDGPPLSGDPFRNFSPAWSPDGLTLAWAGTATGDLLDSDIYIASADTSDRIEISTAGTGTDPTPNLHPAWAPDLGDPFTDVSGSFARADVSCIFALGVTTGTTGTTYSPAQPVTRQEMAAFLANLWHLGLGRTCPAGTNPFTDISASFAQSQINCIFQLGVTGGTGDGTTYSPAQPVTREQMAAFLARFWAKAIGLTL